MDNIKELFKEITQIDVPYSDFDGFIVEFLSWAVNKEKTETFEEWIVNYGADMYMNETILKDYLQTLKEREKLVQINNFLKGSD